MLNNLTTFLVLASTPAPTPTPGGQPGVKIETAGPGAIGFIFTALVVVATIFLLMNMSRKIRRVRYNEQVRQEFEGTAEELTQESSARGRLSGSSRSPRIIPPRD